MKDKILKLISESKTNDDIYKDLDSIYTLYEQLQFSTNLVQMAQDIFAWLRTKYNIDNMQFDLIDINKNSKQNVYHVGQEFNLDDDLSFYFIITTHTSLNAIVSFRATSNVHYRVLKEKHHYIIDTAFFQISPIIQNGIMKKNYVESSSFDMLTNVYTRDHLVRNLEKHLKLTKYKNNEIYFFMIGIDRFKAVTDEFGYDIGDQFLIELSKVIYSNISNFDMVARLNADEFLVTILDSSSEFEAVNLAKKIIDDFKELEIIVNQETGQVIKKTICVGFDVFKINGVDSIKEAIKNVDIALYEAKNLGRSELFKFSDLKDEDTLELF